MASSRSVEYEQKPAISQTTSVLIEEINSVCDQIGANYESKFLSELSKLGNVKWELYSSDSAIPAYSGLSAVSSSCCQKPDEVFEEIGSLRKECKDYREITFPFEGTESEMEADEGLVNGVLLSPSATHSDFIETVVIFDPDQCPTASVPVSDASEFADDEDIEKVYICFECPVAFRTDSELKMHERVCPHKVLQDDASQFSCQTLSQREVCTLYTCRQCTFSCRSELELAKHEATHNICKSSDCSVSLQSAFDEEVHKVNQSALSFEDSVEWWQHEKFKLHEESNCDICGFSCQTLQELESHTELHAINECIPDEGETTRKMHKCPDCGRPFRDPSKLAEHAVIHKFYQCPQCPRSFRTAGLVEMHMELCHSRKHCDLCAFSCVDLLELDHHRTLHKAPWKCDSCSFCSKTQDELRKHRAIHKVHQCRECSVLFNDAYQLAEHKVVHNVYQCNQCALLFKSASELNRHKSVESHHLLKCDACDFTCNFLYDLTEHEEVHKHLQCDACEFTCKFPGDLQKHEEEVHKVYKCDNCSFSSRTYQELIQHLVIHGVHICRICLGSFKDAAELEKHGETHKLYLCSLCPVGYKTLVGLQKHVKGGIHMRLPTVENQDETYAQKKRRTEVLSSSTDRQLVRAVPFKYKCQKCRQLFRVCDELLEHEKIHKPYQCPICPLSFSSDVELQDHRKGGVHIRQKNHIQQKNYLQQKNHIQQNNVSVPHSVSHSSLPYQCRSCERSFHTTSELAEHEKRHKPSLYPCRQCPLSFSSYSELKSHVQECVQQALHALDETFHLQPVSSLDTPYSPNDAVGSRKELEKQECRDCNTTFNTVSDLTEHQKTHQGIYACSQCLQRFRTLAEAVDHLKDGVHMEKQSMSEQLVPKIDIPYSSSSAGLDNVVQREEPKKYECFECKVSFNSVSELTDHGKIHQVVLYRCSQCPLSFRTFPELNNHLKEGVHVQEQTTFQPLSSNLEISSSRGSGPESASKRHEFVSSFSSTADMANHQKVQMFSRTDVELQVHKQEARHIHTGSGSRSLTLSFKSASGINQQNDILNSSDTDSNSELVPLEEEESFQCPKCLLSFRKQIEFDEHTKTHREYECLKCKLFFETYPQLTKHCKKHLIYQCPECPFVFPIEKDLLKHIALRHSSQKDS